ncbi:hypothetical protein [Ruicaihuangia caeni]|uniref:Uncharacterized protein n=1 Tax=Ruicaihuangia caeni TaxID=3042517 RepID=A0AAW6T144_9MICO|nr:hypothetical protein [Klugiella sp. YN-L-19]MDI2097550.1 hypothetical protein [Klugiella sp. YN-L-19]
MEWLVLAVVALAVVAMCVGSLRFRRSGAGSGDGLGGLAGALGVMDEVFNPAQRHAREHLETEKIVPAPAPLAGDRPLEEGRITIRLPRR